MGRYFITGTGTDVGKTLVTCALSWQLQQRGRKVTALKPIISGYNPQDGNNDTACILAASGAGSVEQVALWRFAAPVSPHLAAAREGRAIDVATLTRFCEEASGDTVLVEGVGGVMVPLTHSYTVLDWMAALHWPVILVAGTYLGAMSHVLTALEVLKIRGLTLHAIIISESLAPGATLAEMEATLETFAPAGITIVQLPRIAVSDEAWRHAPDISWLCESWDRYGN